MAKSKSNEEPSKSDLVREYLKSHSSATVRQIVEDLKPHGISTSLAQKIKSKDGGSGKRRRRARKSRGAAPVAASKSSKADHIRRVAGGMGKRIRPRDVIAALASEGVKVSYAQVGQVLKGLGMRRRGRKGAGQRTGGRTRGRRSAGRAAAASGADISLDALIAAKKLADALGGVQAAKQAVDALARLA